MPDTYEPTGQELADPMIDRQPTSADDIVTMIADVLYEYLPPESGVSPREALSRVLAIIETPLALEVVERELERRHPRDASRWH
jgi:hypothetical protein